MKTSIKLQCWVCSKTNKWGCL